MQSENKDCYYNKQKMYNLSKCTLLLKIEHHYPWKNTYWICLLNVRIFCTFRSGNAKLPLERGRWLDIPHEIVNVPFVRVMRLETYFIIYFIVQME